MVLFDDFFKFTNFRNQPIHLFIDSKSGFKECLLVSLPNTERLVIEALLPLERIQDEVLIFYKNLLEAIEKNNEIKEIQVINVYH